MTKLLSDYCVYVENQLPSKICDDLVNLFESVPDQYLNRIETKNNKPRFTQFSFSREKNLNEELYRTVCQYLVKAVLHYRIKIKSFSEWAPEHLYFENIRIKRYISEDKDEFDTHVDVWNKKNEERYLSFMWYLNDVADGGATEFTELDFKVQPKKGALLMFPLFGCFLIRATYCILEKNICYLHIYIIQNQKILIRKFQNEHR